MVLGHECGIYILSQEIFRGFRIAIMYIIEYCVSMSSHPICEDLQSRCYFPHFIDQEPEPQGRCKSVTEPNTGLKSLGSSIIPLALISHQYPFCLWNPAHSNSQSKNFWICVLWLLSLACNHAFHPNEQKMLSWLSKQPFLTGQGMHIQVRGWGWPTSAIKPPCSALPSFSSSQVLLCSGPPESSDHWLQGPHCVVTSLWLFLVN